MTEMTRADALERAIEMANYAERAAAPDFAMAQARIAEAWLAIHDRLPAQSAYRERWAGPIQEQDIKKCRHGLIAWLNGDHWVHPGALDECDNPPITDGPLP